MNQSIDGRGTTITPTAASPQTFGAYEPLGLDCNELWAFGEADNRLNILRIELDTLPPEPPGLPGGPL